LGHEATNETIDALGHEATNETIDAKHLQYAATGHSGQQRRFELLYVHFICLETEKLPHDQAHSKERKLSCLGQSSRQALPRRELSPTEVTQAYNKQHSPSLYLL
jgi:hypothetical protein